MKKLLFGILLALICKLGYCQPSAADSLKISLNGIAYRDAGDMVKRFKDNNNKKPLMTSIWFSSTMIKNMVALLNAEKGPTGVRPDGVRMYFATNKNMQNTLILVSTYENGVNATTQKKIHQDYFQRSVVTSEAIALFKNSGDISGSICTDNTCGGGALLYQKCPCVDDLTCDHNEPHYITKEHAMQMVWNFGTDVINTSSVWYDIDLLNSMAASKRFDGIRMYFSRHAVIDDMYPGKDGIVLVTTEKGGVDYFDCADTRKYFTKVYKNFLRGAAIVVPNPKPEGEDRSEQCEPSCDGVSL